MSVTIDKSLLGSGDPNLINRCMAVVHRSNGPETRCCSQARWNVCLDTRTSKKDEPYRFRLPTRICSKHKRGLEISDVVTGRSWSFICAQMRLQGQTRVPTRKLTKLTFEAAEPIGKFPKD